VIRPATAADAPRIVDTTASYPWLVSELDGAMVGYAYASSWKRRSAYRYAVESTIYLAPEFHGRGLGSELYRALIAEMRARGFHCPTRQASRCMKSWDTNTSASSGKLAGSSGNGWMWDTGNCCSDGRAAGGEIWK
jgi:GNAT superfamily N-acetyltransferase